MSARPLPIFAVAVAIAGALLAGCGASSQDELQGWIADERAATRPHVTPIPEPKKFTPQAYTQEGSTDPFSNVKLTQALKRESAQATSNAALVAPELARRKEPLEAFPLEQLKMVGTLSQGNDTFALVRADKTLYRVKKGNYMGQNFGLITDVNDNEIKLKEIVQDSAGDWAERQSVLPLLEEAGKGDKK